MTTLKIEQKMLKKSQRKTPHFFHHIPGKSNSYFNQIAKQTPSQFSFLFHIMMAKRYWQININIKTNTDKRAIDDINYL